MAGAHLDSWHSATGATDNADGVATVMEAVRILKTLGVQPRRTIRIALWAGEEQGLLGSRAYVQQHLSGDANASRARSVFRLFQLRQRLSADRRLLSRRQPVGQADRRGVARAARLDRA